MSNPTKEYLEGSTRAYAEDAGVENPGPFSNPYDPWFPMRAAEWENGYNEARIDIRRVLTSSKAS